MFDKRSSKQKTKEQLVDELSEKIKSSLKAYKPKFQGEGYYGKKDFFDKDKSEPLNDDEMRYARALLKKKLDESFNKALTEYNKGGKPEDFLKKLNELCKDTENNYNKARYFKEIVSVSQYKDVPDTDDVYQTGTGYKSEYTGSTNFGVEKERIDPHGHKFKNCLDNITTDLQKYEDLIKKAESEEDKKSRESKQLNTVKQTVNEVIEYLKRDHNTHGKDIEQLQKLAKIENLDELKQQVSKSPRGQSSVTRTLYDAIKKSDESNIDDQMTKVSNKITERTNYHDNEKILKINFSSFKSMVKEMVEGTKENTSNLDENDKSDDDSSDLKY